jgi:hypothetical protein
MTEDGLIRLANAERSLLIFAAVIEKRPAVFDHVGKYSLHRLLSQGWIIVEVADELSAGSPHIVNVLLNRCRR